jgi:hypothetical protein
LADAIFIAVSTRSSTFIPTILSDEDHVCPGSSASNTVSPRLEFQRCRYADSLRTDVDSWKYLNCLRFGINDAPAFDYGSDIPWKTVANSGADSFNTVLRQ